jgi:hypothetical protein
MIPAKKAIPEYFLWSLQKFMIQISLDGLLPTTAIAATISPPS